MNVSAEHIPEHVFDWLQHHDFADLPQDAQAEVLQYGSEADYTHLRKTAGLLQAARLAVPPFAAQRSKERLLQEVSARAAKTPIRLSGLAVWRAAAAVLFLIAAVLGYSALRQSRPAVVVNVLETRDSMLRAGKPDTVFVHAAAPRVRQPLRTRRSRGETAPVVLPDAPAARFAHTEPQGIRPLSPGDYKNPENAARGTSLKEEGLTKDFSFVSL